MKTTHSKDMTAPKPVDWVVLSVAILGLGAVVLTAMSNNMERVASEFSVELSAR
jgi:hypothetical protein